MQKKMIILAIAGSVALPAAAQSSNVTVYGIADMFLSNVSGGGGTVTGVDSGGENGSRLGFKGKEDLGNGLKAVFDFQFGSLGLDGSKGISSTRYSFVGLEGAFGSVVAGRLQTPGYYTSYYYDPGMAHFFSAYQFLGKGIAKNGVGASINTGWNAPSRQDNAIAYALPVFGGLKTTIAYAFGEQDGIPSSEKRQGVLALSLDYANGPLKGSYSYHRIDNIGGVNKDQQEHYVGGSYNFGMVTLMGSVQTAKVSGAGIGSQTDKLYSVGANINIARATHLMVGYAKADVDAKDADGKGYTLGIMHSLSKRTHIYTGYGRTTNDDATNQFNMRDKYALKNGSSNATFGIGISHMF